MCNAPACCSKINRIDGEIEGPGKRGFPSYDPSKKGFVPFPTLILVRIWKVNVTLPIVKIEVIFRNVPSNQHCLF